MQSTHIIQSMNLVRDHPSCFGICECRAQLADREARGTSVCTFHGQVRNKSGMGLPRSMRRARRVSSNSSWLVRPP